MESKLAYLVIREGPKWTDVFRLVEGRTVTIGRAPTNQIVIKDERCSRYHAEVFSTKGSWILRDLDSRNGTDVGGERIRGDHSLSPGEIIRIAHAQLAFVYDLSSAFSDSAAAPQAEGTDDETINGRGTDDASVLEGHEPTTITHRRGQTRFLKPRVEEDEEDESSIPEVGRAAAKLCRLAFELANQPDVVSVAKIALDGLFEGATVDGGAILLLPRDYKGPSAEAALEVIASRTDSEPTYHRVSSFLATTVLREGEAVLARNVEDDSTLGIRDSQGQIHATSVLCAPIRQDRRVVGLVHLYSTDETRRPDADDLEFTLAVADNVALALKNLSRQQELAENLTQTKDEILQLRKRLGAESQLIGTSPLMRKIQEQILQAAPSRATVLLRGESGVGKELVARAVHYASPRKKGPFVCLNCAALSESLLESELFGHERGAFTGATDRNIGKFEAADKGTLMLDEIGEMSPATQAKFLRVLEGHPFERVGGSSPITVDVRVIAATNRDLEKAVSEGKFRRDLYFRLHVVEIVVPPLRKRPEDILELANYFLARYKAETGRKLRGFAPEALAQLQSYRWPGNVRELKNVIERAVVLARGEWVEIEDLNLSNLATASDSAELVLPSFEYEPMTLAESERRHIIATLKANGWNKSRTAVVLGIERSTLDRKIRRYGLASEQGTSESA
jgi:Nif-specific regulatory protein